MGLGVSIVLVAVGAILTWAVTAQVRVAPTATRTMLTPSPIAILLWWVGRQFNTRTTPAFNLYRRGARGG